MSGRNELDLDAVLPPEPAPIPRQEPAAAPTAVAVAERPPVRQEARPVIREARPVQRETRPEVRETRPVIRETRPVRQEARPEVRETRPVVREARPAIEEARPVIRETRPEARDGRAARRRQTGIKRMLLALAALAVLLTGLLIWTIHDEKQAVAEDPEIISLDLGEALEEYLDEAPTRMRG